MEQSRSPVVDGHNDLLMLVSSRDDAEQAGYFRRHWLPQLRSGGVGVQVLPVYVDDCFRPEGALRQALRMIGAAHRIGRECADEVVLCRTGDDLDDARATDRVGLVLALEGCEPVGQDVGLFDVLFELGVRMASLTHFGRNALADGSAEDAAGSRLTRAGVKAVEAMERLGIIVDVSHLSAAGTDQVLSMARRPVIASHSSAGALCHHHRNLTDDRLRGVADSGGVVGVNFFHGFIDPEQPTIDRVVDHVAHIAEVAGITHVGLGSDFMTDIIRETMPGDGPILIEGLDARRCIPGLEGPAGFPLVLDRMARRGFSKEDVAAVAGGNFLRVFQAQGWANEGASSTAKARSST
jgi:membrane dipeptidase